eukprot:scaffold7052_cov254-Pinguiococcus_pyrenoidosus.AAC.114
MFCLTISKRHREALGRSAERLTRGTWRRRVKAHVQAELRAAARSCGVDGNGCLRAEFPPSSSKIRHGTASLGPCEFALKGSPT